MSGEPSRRRQIAAWCLFDFANSSFTTVVITVVYSVYFTTVIASHDGPLLWNVALTVSNAVIILTAPVVGAIADRSSNKKRFLFFSYLVCVAATAMLFLATPGQVALAMGLFIVANIAFASGENLVAGFLPELAEQEEMGKISGLGWGVGYAGGLGALALCLPLAMTGDDLAIRATNLVVAVFFLVGGIPTFVWVREKRRHAGVTLRQACVDGFSRVLTTFGRRHRHPDLFRFLLAYLLFSTGIYGVIGNAGIYAKTLFGLEEQSDIILVFIVSQVTAAAGAFWSGRHTAGAGCVRTVRVAVLVWILCSLVALLTSGPAGFWVVALLAGFAIGASLASSRAVVGLFAPPDHSGEFFGYWGVYARLAALTAPAGNALLLWLTGGSLRFGIAYFAAAFVAGLALLGRVDEARGRAAARALPPTAP